MPLVRHMNDNDFRKGAVEENSPQQDSQVSQQGQLPHREQDPLIKAADTDFPEPGENPEHSGEPEENLEAMQQNQDSEDRQKRNQG